MESVKFTATVSVLLVDNWWAYVTGAEMQFVPALLTMDKLYIDGSPASTISNNLKEILHKDEILYINGQIKKEEGYVRQAAVILAWRGKKIKKIPEMPEELLLYNKEVLYDLQTKYDFKEMSAVITNGIGKFKETSATTANIIMIWEPRIKLKFDLTKSNVTELNAFKKDKNVLFHAIQQEDAGEWLLLKLWIDDVQYEHDLCKQIKLPSNDIPILNWQFKKDFNVTEAATNDKVSKTATKMSKMKVNP